MAKKVSQMNMRKYKETEMKCFIRTTEEDIKECIDESISEDIKELISEDISEELERKMKMKGKQESKKNRGGKNWWSVILRAAWVHVTGEKNWKMYKMFDQTISRQSVMSYSQNEGK